MQENKVNYAFSIIIPVYNQWELTKNCLVSLKQYTPGENFEVIVVDNGSSDDTNTYCPVLGQNLFGQQFKYLRLEKNINFGPACNLGAKNALGDFLFFLNNDTLVTENWLPPLLNAFDEDKNLGAVGPLLLYPNHTVQHLGICTLPLKHIFHLYSFFPTTHPVVMKKRYLQAITGAAMMVPRQLFGQSGGFYEGYQNGYEDIDLCFQIRGMGKKVAVLPESRILHFTSQTSGRYLYEEDNIALVTKRCGQTNFPNIHKFYHEDGYEFELTYFFRLTPRLSKARRAFLLENKPVQFDWDWYMQKLQEEPFWWQGYMDVWNFCIRSREWKRAEKIIFRAGLFFPPEDLLSKLEFLLGKTKKESLKAKVEGIKAILKKDAALMQDKNVLAYIKMLAGRDEILRPAILKWQQKYGIK